MAGKKKAELELKAMYWIVTECTNHLAFYSIQSSSIEVGPEENRNATRKCNNIK